MITKTLIHEPRDRPLGMVIALAGRNVSVTSMFGFVSEMGLHRSIITVMEPRDREWYPQPNGPGDQRTAIDGLNNTAPSLRSRIRSLRDFFNLTQDRVALIGYSAGGVVCLRMAEMASREFACVASIAGVILDPANLNQARTNTPILLRHNADDEVFGWDERFVPTRDALINKGYNITVEEEPVGGHGVTLEDAHLIGRFVATHLGYFAKA